MELIKNFINLFLEVWNKGILGIDKFDSVVNKDLKIHGVNNLYVSGSSNFATGGYTNPTFTIIQLAIRLAEEINKRLYSLMFS